MLKTDILGSQAVSKVSGKPGLRLIAVEKSLPDPSKGPGQSHIDDTSVFSLWILSLSGSRMWEIVIQVLIGVQFFLSLGKRRDQSCTVHHRCSVGKIVVIVDQLTVCLLFQFFHLRFSISHLDKSYSGGIMIARSAIRTEGFGPLRCAEIIPGKPQLEK